jgi:SSS family transporter
MNLTISLVDVGIIALYLVGVVAFGLWIGRRQRNVADYLLGDRDLPWWLLLLSIVSTETSSLTFLSVPGVAYDGDMTFLQLAMGYVVGRYAIVALLLPQYFRGELYTAYEALERRFGSRAKRVASAIFMVTRCLADGLRLLATAIVLRAMIFPRPSGAVETIGALDPQLTLAVLIMGVGMIIYTYFGGLKAVVWVDFAQFFIYLAGAAVAAAVLLSRLPGGWTELIDYGRDFGKLQLFDWQWDVTRKYTFWSGVIGGAFISLASHGADQLMVQRYLAARSQRDAARALKWSGWIVLAQFGFFLLIGVGLSAFYRGQSFGRQDEVFATFIVEELPVGALGLTLAAVFAAAMSSSLNALASAGVRDFYLPLIAPHATPERQLRVTRRLTILFGVLQIAAGIGGQLVRDRAIVEAALSIANFTTGIVLGIFFLGVLTRRVGEHAALAALIGGLAVMFFVAFGTKIAYTWYAVIGTSATFAIGILASLIFEKRRPTTP